MAHVEVRGQLFRSLSFHLLFEAGSLSLLLLLCWAHQFAKDCPVSSCLSSRHRITSLGLQQMRAMVLLFWGV